jgi:glutamyl-Q tRNA(Asp) synthetase
MPFVTRFAPSPTGRLHLGHAFSALTAHDAARAAGGRFLLRIEDLDGGRARPEFEAAILADLAWLGIAWDEPPRRQSEHMAEYAGVLDALIARGLCYRCFKTRKEVLAALADAPHGQEAPFFGARLSAEEEAARLAAGEAFAWRLDAARARDFLPSGLAFSDDTGAHAVDPLKLGDAVLARKDFPASYHLACVHDDALQGVTHVIRGADLRDSAHLHVVLQNLLGLPTPAYVHHRLIVDETGKRLAKRDDARAISALREAGATVGDVRARLGL